VLLVSLLVFGLFTPVFAQLVCVLDAGGNLEPTHTDFSAGGLLILSSIDEDMIMSDPSAWVGRTVVVEGSISPYLPPGWWWPPWNYELSSNGTTIGVSWQGGDYNIYNGINVTVLGVITAGQWNEMLANGTVIQYGPVDYFIQAIAMEPL
jgi:hypothetical protein